MSIHPSALVSEKATIGSNPRIGAFAVIEDHVKLGDDCQIDAAAQIRNGSEIGNQCHIGSGAIIGADPHFIGFDPTTSSGVVLGEKNEIREYVTIHRSIENEGVTILGNENYLMSGAHVGHDCTLGNSNTLANNVLLGGHVEMGNHCFFGGGAVVHQFVRLGDYIMAQGLSGVSLDIPHYLIISGINTIGGINAVGLKRAGLGPESRREIKEAFRRIYRGSETLAEVLDAVEKAEHSPEVNTFYDFFRQKSKKGVCVRFG
ncbi:MAG: acyl-ACP--UDP-N-acetylglucosamine O-acyltransferase [Verrucomicrobiota bacterium]